jgi:hypothetical protein
MCLLFICESNIKQKYLISGKQEAHDCRSANRDVQVTAVKTGHSNTGAWTQRFSDGSQYAYYSGNASSRRCVR